MFIKVFNSKKSDFFEVGGSVPTDEKEELSKKIEKALQRHANRQDEVDKSYAEKVRQEDAKLSEIKREREAAKNPSKEKPAKPRVNPQPAPSKPKKKRGIFNFFSKVIHLFKKLIHKIRS